MKINYKILINKYFIISLIINALEFYIIYSLNSFILNNSSQWESYNSPKEMVYYIMMISMLIVAFDNDTYSGTKSESWLFLSNIGFAIRKVINLIVYFHYSPEFRTFFNHFEFLFFIFYRYNPNTLKRSEKLDRSKRLNKEQHYLKLRTWLCDN